MPPEHPHQGPATELIPLGEQFANHDEFALPPSDALAGRDLTLHLSGAARMVVRFEDAGIVQVVCERVDARTSLLAIVDLDRARAALNLTRLLDGPDGVVEHTRVHQAGIGGPIAERFPLTDELVGKRVHHRYSTTHAFEQIYLNATTYAFQGLEGPEAGVADVDRSDTHRIADDLYLFSWHERSQPFNGAIALDLREGRASGRLFGWDEETGRALHIRTGSIATLLNETSYEGL